MEPNKPKARNRRRSFRRKPRGSSKAELRKGTMGLGPNLAICFLDVSESGASVLVKSELPRGQEVELLLQGISHRRPYKVLGQVMWCVPAPEQRWCIGVQFHRSLPYIELQKFF